MFKGNNKDIGTTPSNLAGLEAIVNGWTSEWHTHTHTQHTHTHTHAHTQRRSLVYSEINQTAHSQPAITCSKLTLKTLEQGVKYVQT